MSGETWCSTFRSDGRASHRRWPRCACSSVRKGRPSPPAKRSCATAANRIPFSERRRILSLSLCDDDARPSLIVIALPSELVGPFGPIIARLTRVADISRKGDRKSLGEGKRVSVRVDVGGRRIEEKKKK